MLPQGFKSREEDELPTSAPYGSSGRKQKINVLKFLQKCKNFASDRISALSIRQKIQYGYTLALGIAVTGTTIGVLAGNHYQAEALKLQYKIRDQKALLSDLQVAMLKTRSQQKELTFYLLASPNVPEKKYDDFIEQVNSVKELLAKVQNAKATDHLSSLSVDLADYNHIVDAYLQQVQLLIKRLPSENFNFEQPRAVEQRVLSLTYNSAFQQFDDLTDQLTQFFEVATAREQSARANVEDAKILRDLTITCSILLSISIGILLALYTSLAIAKPIEALTHVARQVTENADFSLRTRITTKDEVGQLATSLNQLIQSVSDYTRELEIGKQTLEERVAKRTQELSLKNHELQAAHSQLQRLYQQLKHTLNKLQQTQAQLIQTEKMSSLGQMVAGVAHEINNPVNFIYGNINHIGRYANSLLELVDLYNQAYPEASSNIQAYQEEIDVDFISEDLPKLLNSVKSGADRIRQIVLSLRSFSRLDEADMKTVDVHEGIDSTLILLKHRLPEHIDVIRQFGTLPLLNCYPAQLNQVFFHLISNAIDAVLAQEEKTGKNKESGNQSALTYKPTIWLETQAEKRIVIRIGDNGIGIPPDVQPKIFDPFFTTKPIGQGAGLGLSICYQIMQRHQGDIKVTSEAGKGTEVILSLPIQT